MIAWFKTNVTNRKGGETIANKDGNKIASFLFTTNHNEKNILSVERYHKSDNTCYTQVVYLDHSNEKGNFFNSNSYDLTYEQYEEFVRKLAEKLTGCIVIRKGCKPEVEQ